MDLKMKILDKNLFKILELQNQYPNLYIGGSISLLLQNAIPYREISDIDLITVEPYYIYDIFDINRDIKHKIRRYNYNGTINELFKNKNAQYLNFNYKGHIIKISPISEIMEWKQRFNHINKHKKDLELYDKTNTIN